MTPQPVRTAFTMIELLVVVAVIAILLGAIIAGGSALISKAKASDTRALFQTLALAVEQFKDDAPTAKVAGYTARYANYPPDELEVFSAADGIPPSGANLLGTGARLEDESDTVLSSPLDAVEHRDVKAMVLAVRLFSAAGAEILDQVDERFRRRGQTATGLAEYYDRDQTGSNNSFREPLIYYVDSWGTPIEYYATNLPGPSGSADVDTDRLTGDPAKDPYPGYPEPGARRIASTAFVAANNGVPLFVSYGSDGEDQFAEDFIADATIGQTQLVWDFNDDYVGGALDRAINHKLNADNVYSSPDLAAKLANTLP